jgi:hypothetical protein
LYSSPRLRWQARYDYRWRNPPAPSFTLPALAAGYPATKQPNKHGSPNMHFTSHCTTFTQRTFVAEMPAARLLPQLLLLLPLPIGCLASR